MFDFPRTPMGSSNQALFSRSVLDLIKQCRPLPNDSQYGLELTAVGWRLKMKQARGGSSSALQRMIVKEIKSDWFNCLPYDKDGEHGTSENYIKVAKPWELRFSDWDGQTVDGISFSYAGEDLNWSRRKATRGSITEIHIVVRPWYVGEIILAATNITGGTDATDDGPADDGVAPFTDLVWEDTNQAAHAWAQTDISDPGDADL